MAYRVGALLGYETMEEKWKRNLECADVILEIADDLCHGCEETAEWMRKYSV